MGSPVDLKAMYVILGATGNTGTIVANSLLLNGKNVRVALPGDFLHPCVVFLDALVQPKRSSTAPTGSSTPNLHRATIAQQRVRMEGWGQRRLGSMGTISKKKK
jgi:hypothetical protein